MKSLVRLFLLLAVALLIFSTLIHAQEIYFLPVGYTINPGYTYINFDGTTYKFYAMASYYLMLESVDGRYVKVFVKPMNRNVRLSDIISIKWAAFPPVSLMITAPGGQSIELDTETGYAEK